MKKSNFMALILGTISIMFFALGMCMVMLPQWNAFNPGIIAGCVGLLFALITVIVWRKMEHKAPIKITGRAVITVILGILGVLALGLGMCFTMVWNALILGVVIGLVGILLLLALIPFCKGLK